MFAPPLGGFERARTSVIFHWWAGAWLDLSVRPGLSLSIGLMIAVISVICTGSLEAGGLGFFILPYWVAYGVVWLFLALPATEISRRLDRNLSLNVRDIFGLWGRHTRSLLCLFFGTSLAFVVWFQAVDILIFNLLGNIPSGFVASLIYVVKTMPWPWLILLVVTALFLYLAGLLVFLNVLPALLDGKCDDAFSAIRHGFRLVVANPGTMAIWAVLSGIALFIATASILGLVVVAPLMGHAMWHAYQDLGRGIRAKV